MGLFVLIAVLCLGAFVGARTQDKVQGVVQTEIVNDTGHPIQIALCHSAFCSEADPSQTLTSGAAFDQALGAYDHQRFSVRANVSAVDVPTPQCRQLNSGESVKPKYLLSQLVPCS